MKRLCLYAGFSHKHIVEDYVVHAVCALSEHADVYYLAANLMPEAELRKLDPYVKGRWSIAHDKYDFGSWQKMLFKLGWDSVTSYDALILANDSCYGPLYPLADVFQTMSSRHYDFWGITTNNGVYPHIQSYFLYITKDIFRRDFFQNFFENIGAEKSKEDICVKYEIGLSKIIIENGMTWGVFIDRYVSNIPSSCDISEYQNTLLRSRSPFIKRKIFLDPGFAQENIADTLELLKKYHYPFNFFPSVLNSSAQPEGGTLAAVPARIFRASLFARLRKAGKSIFMVFYNPIKKRIVTKIDTVYDQSAMILSESRQMTSMLSAARILNLHSEIKALFTSLHDMEGRLSVKASTPGDSLCSPFFENKIAESATRNAFHLLAGDSPRHEEGDATATYDDAVVSLLFRICESVFPPGKTLDVLDCSNAPGQILASALLRGHASAGLQWVSGDTNRFMPAALADQCLFPCDIRKAFTVGRGKKSSLFDVIVALGAFASATEPDWEILFANLHNHSRQDGVVVFGPFQEQTQSKTLSSRAMKDILLQHEYVIMQEIKYRSDFYILARSGCASMEMQ